MREFDKKVFENIRELALDPDAPDISKMPPMLFRIMDMGFLGDGVIGITDPQELREDFGAWGRSGMEYFNRVPCMGFVLAAIVEEEDGVDRIVMCIYHNNDVNSYKTTLQDFKNKKYGDWFDIREVVPDFGYQLH